MSTKKKKLMVALLCIILMVCGVAAAEETEKTVDDVLAEIESAFDARAEEYAVQVRTLENGIKIQRTPAAEDDRFRRMRDSYVSTNNYYFNADNRGCAACHNSLADVADNLEDYPHCKMNNAMGIEITVQMCMDCHNCSGTIESKNTFGAIIHGQHDNRNAAFRAMGGDCWSCHYGTDYDGLQLWDEVKHDVLRGITHLNNTATSGTFSWNQEKVLDNEDVFSYNWMDGNMAYVHYAKEKLNMVPDPEADGIYDQWKILIGGEVETPMHLTLNELIEKCGLETRTVTAQCMVNPVGGPLISNFEMTGIPVSKIAEMVGVKDTAKSFRAGADGTIDMEGIPPYGTHAPSQLPVDWIETYDFYLCVEIDGKPLPYKLGYPVMFVTPFGGAYLNYMEMTELIFIKDETIPATTLYWGGKDDDGTYVDMPNVGIFDLMEGQVFENEETLIFHGYAHTLGDSIKSVDISFDNGKTWISNPVEDDDPTRWVCWTFEWMPPAKGSYVITLRSVEESGDMTPEPIEKLFHVQ